MKFEEKKSFFSEKCVKQTPKNILFGLITFVFGPGPLQPLGWIGLAGTDLNFEIQT